MMGRAASENGCVPWFIKPASPNFAKLPQTIGSDERQYFRAYRESFGGCGELDILCCAGRHAAAQPVLLTHRDILFDGALCKFWSVFFEEPSNKTKQREVANQPWLGFRMEHSWKSASTIPYLGGSDQLNWRVTMQILSVSPDYASKHTQRARNGRAARNSCWALYDCGCVSNLWANLVNMVNPTANRAQIHHKFPTFQNWRFMTGSHGRVPWPIPNCLKDFEGKHMRTPQKNLVNMGFSLAFRLSSTQKFRHLHKSSSWAGKIIKFLSFWRLDPN